MLSAQLPPPNGTADDKVQAYNFRLTVTTNANRLPWTAPPNYDPAQYELLKRAIQATNPTAITQLLQLAGAQHAQRRQQMGRQRQWQPTMVSTDYVGFSKDYPDADYATREQIIADHRNYEQGYLYFLATDPSVPLAVRNGMNSYGLATDEFTDNGNWPNQIYVREARRMIGRYVMTEADDLEPARRPATPSPWAPTRSTRTARRSSSTPTASRTPKATSASPLRSPTASRTARSRRRESQASNLLVSSAISASRVGYGSIRMEPQYMMMGQAAGAAAALALNGNTSVQQVNYSALRTQLLADGAASLGHCRSSASPAPTSTTSPARSRAASSFRTAARISLVRGTSRPRKTSSPAISPLRLAATTARKPARILARSSAPSINTVKAVARSTRR